MKNKAAQSVVLYTLLRTIDKLLNRFLDLRFCQETSPPEDHINVYAREVLSLGLLLMEFNDAIRECDGGCIIRCWRYFLLLFKANQRTNYAIEAFTLLVQFDFLLPHRLARQLAWSHTTSTHGKPGKNISCDIHLEHLNREAKNQIDGLGSNITDDSVKRVGNALVQVLPVLQQCDRVNGIKLQSGGHSKRACDKDMEVILKQLHERSKVFCVITACAHKSFPRF